MKTKYLPVKYHSLVEQYPNFHRSGSIQGMKTKYYGKSAMLVRCGQYIYNVPQKIYDIAK